MIGYILLLFGAIALIASVIFTSQIFAFIGLGLAFWGALLLYIKPSRYVKASLLDSTAISSLVNLEKIIKELNYQGRPIYLPPQRIEIYHLERFKGGAVFIPAENSIIMPSIEEIVEGKVFCKNPKGICLAPPGLGLTNLFEKELRTDLSKVKLNYLQNSLPKLLIEDLELVKDFEMNIHKNIVHAKMTRPVYEGLCNEVKRSTNICSYLGCPLCSSIACMLTKVVGKPVVIERNEISPNAEVVETWYRIVEG